MNLCGLILPLSTTGLGHRTTAGREQSGGFGSALPQGQRGPRSGGAEPQFLVLSASVLHSNTRTDPQQPAAAPKGTPPVPGVTVVPRPLHRSQRSCTVIELHLVWSSWTRAGPGFSVIPYRRSISPLHSGAGPLHTRFTPSSEVQ